MAENAVLSKNFVEFNGIDVRSNDHTRRPQFAKMTKNVEYLQNNSFSAVKGQKGIATSRGGGGTTTYVRAIGGVAVEELVTIDNNLWRLKEGSFTISYAGTGVANIILDPYTNSTPVTEDSTFGISVKAFVDDFAFFNQPVGIGRGEASPYTINDLSTDLSAANPDFTCTIVGEATTPAAFLPYTLDGIPLTGLTIPFQYWEQIYSPVSNPFQSFANTFGTDSFQLASFLNTSNRLFIATGYTPEYKYDGVTLFRSGMPAATTYNAVLATGPGLTGDYESFVTYQHIDEMANVVEGDESNHVVLTAANQQITHTIPYLPGTSGFNTCSGQVNGPQTGTTITLFSGHNLKVGQTAFWVDSTAPYAEHTAKITVATATTITLASSATVVNNQIISAGLRVNLWRNVNGSTEIFYLVRSFPNWTGSTTTSFTESVSDNDLLEQPEYIPPVTNHGLPPANQRYLTSYKGLKIACGETDKVYYSDYEDPEYYSDQSSSYFILRSKSNAPVRACGANREILAVFKEDESHVITGDLPDGNYTQSVLGDAIGCTSHASVVDVDGTLWFYSGRFGVRRLIGNSIPDDMSYYIQPLFRQQDETQDFAINHSRVVAIAYERSELVIFYCPTETLNRPNENSFCLVADYRSQMETYNDYDNMGRIASQVPKIRWWRWVGFNLGGGGAIYNKRLVWTERQYFDAVSDFRYTLCQRLEDGTENDYTSFGGMIPWEYEAAWDDMDFPDVLKKFLQVNVHSFPEFESTSFDVTVSTELNFNNGATHSQKVISFGGGGVSGGWGVSWDTSPWGDAVDTKRRFELLREKAVAMKLIFQAVVWKTKPVISGWTTEIAAPFEPKIKPQA